MELRQYLNVILRRWPLIAAIVVLTGILSAGLFVFRPTTYTAEARFAVRKEPAPPATPGPYTYDDYYLWFASEFLVDDYTLIVPSQAFAERVVEQMKANSQWNEGLTPAAVAGALTAERKHRVLTVHVASRDEGTANAIIRGVVGALTAQTVNQTGTPSIEEAVQIQDEAMFALLDQSPQAGTDTSRRITNAALTMVVGLALGLALAFLLEFLDNSVRDAADAERALGLPVMGTIPSHK